MPPRITRKSYRPRASDRTMVDRIRPRSLSCFRIRMRRHDNEMNLQTDKRPGGSQHDLGWRARRTSSLLPVAGEVFLLTLPFIERACVCQFNSTWTYSRVTGQLVYAPKSTSDGIASDQSRTVHLANGHAVRRPPSHQLVKPRISIALRRPFWRSTCSSLKGEVCMQVPPSSVLNAFSMALGFAVNRIPGPKSFW